MAALIALGGIVHLTPSAKCIWSQLIKAWKNDNIPLKKSPETPGKLLEILGVATLTFDFTYLILLSEQSLGYTLGIYTYKMTN